MSIESDRQACVVRARLATFKRLLERTRQTIVEALKASHAPYVAFSGGKDSTVVLSLVRSVQNMPAIMGYDDWLLPETVAYTNTVPNLTKVAATIWHSDIYTSWRDGRPERLPDGVVWFDAVKNSRVSPYAKTRGLDCAFIGLRKEEAGYRRLHLCSKGTFYFCKTHQMFECNPIADWTVQDVWAYLLSESIAYNRAYDVMTKIQVPLRYQRVGPVHVERVGGYGQIAILKRGWPEFFNQFATAFPGITAYV